MPDHRGSRFALEVLFLVALAVGLAIAGAEPLVIAGVMLLGWLLVALFEWAAWRDEPHYGSGLPPRYYVPTLNLPPAQPLEQVAAGYPEAQRDEAPTWIASAALRAEVLGEWPVAPHPEPEAAEDEAEERDEPAGEDDRWTRAELPVAPIGEQAQTTPEPAPQAEAERPADAEPDGPEEPEADTDPGHAPADAEPRVDVLPVRPAGATARYSLDPLAEPPQKRRFGRGAEPDVPVLEVAARPTRRRALPARAADE
jgi:hypothetical protein